MKPRNYDRAKTHKANKYGGNFTLCGQEFLEDDEVFSALSRAHVTESWEGVDCGHCLRMNKKGTVLNPAIRITSEEREAIQALLDHSKGSQERSSHGELKSVSALIELLLQDAAQLYTRPGSWEAHGIRELLRSHGYEF